MSVTYDRVNWADYPATTTPVNAENLNKMDKGIADLTSEINGVESEVTGLNSSLTDIDIRYNATTGQPEWRERGAGSFVPFSSGVAEEIIVGYWSSGACAWVWNSDGMYSNAGLGQTSWTEPLSHIQSLSNITGYFKTVTTKKAGYYFTGGYIPYQTCQFAYHNAGETITIGANTDVGVCVYFGETNPFE